MAKKRVKKKGVIMAKKKDERFSTRNIEIKNKLDAEGYIAVESIAPDPLLHIMNVDKSKVRKEECPECGNLVCICSQK